MKWMKELKSSHDPLRCPHIFYSLILTLSNSNTGGKCFCVCHVNCPPFMLWISRLSWFWNLWIGQMYRVPSDMIALKVSSENQHLLINSSPKSVYLVWLLNLSVTTNLDATRCLNHRLFSSVVLCPAAVWYGVCPLLSHMILYSVFSLLD